MEGENGEDVEESGILLPFLFFLFFMLLTYTRHLGGEERARKVEIKVRTSMKIFGNGVRF